VNKEKQKERMTSEERDEWERKDEQALVKRYTRLVQYYLVRMPVYRNPAYDKIDLFSEGLIGLLKAIRKYDVSRSEHSRFTSFAYFYITGAVIDSLRKQEGFARPRECEEKRRFNVTFIPDYLEFSEMAVHFDFSDSVVMNEICRITSRLDEKSKFIFENVGLFGKRFSWCARELSISEYLVNTNYQRTLNEIRKHFNLKERPLSGAGRG